MREIASVEEYRRALRHELAGSDRALLQDALYDLGEIIDSVRAELGDDASRGAVVRRVVDELGTPAELARSYERTEAELTRALEVPRLDFGERWGRGVFGVLVDPRAFGSLVLMVLSLFTGILYFTWAVTGVALSVAFSILIVGLPFVLLFLGSLRGLSLMEGRLIEALTGGRMPRRPPRSDAAGGLLGRLRRLVLDRRTWTSLSYFVLKLPLGVAGFSVAALLLGLSLGLMAAPFVQPFVDEPMLSFGSWGVFLPWWSFPLTWMAAAVDLLLLLHAARLFGRAQLALARGLLVVA